MNYYTFSAIIFSNGQIRDGYNLLYKSETPANFMDFKNYVAGYYAGPPETYSAIVIPIWESISEETYNNILNQTDTII